MASVAGCAHEIELTYRVELDYRQAWGKATVDARPHVEKVKECGHGRC
jgi:hypothetical protein